jgi:hypothetical protein
MRYTQGQSLLALVILIGAIIVIIGATLSFSATAFLTSSYGFQKAGVAEAAANAGAQDALLQLDRNSSFSSTGYSLPVGSSTATVSVTQNNPSTNFITILSQSTVSGSTRKISIIIGKNANSNQLTVISWQETQ